MDNVFVNGTTYYQDGIYTQTLTSAEGCDSVLTVTVDLNFTGLNEFDNSFSVAPNPMTDVLTIHNLLNNNNRFAKTIIIVQQVVDRQNISHRVWCYTETVVKLIQSCEIQINRNGQNRITTFCAC